jgi:hypothetical protein
MTHPIITQHWPVDHQTVSQCPELMGRIINIQHFRAKMDPNYNPMEDLKRLEKLTGAELWEEQNELISKNW